MEVSGLMGQMPSRLGHQPTMSSGTGRSRRAHRQHGPPARSRRSGGLRSRRRLYRSGCASYVFTLVGVDRPVAQAGQRGAFSRRRSPAIHIADVDARHCRSPALWPRAQIRRTLAQYAQLRDVIAMLGLGAIVAGRPACRGASEAPRTLSDTALFATGQFTGQKGRVVSLEDALDGCERILADELSREPVRALYMIGAISGQARAPDRSGRMSPLMSHSSMSPRILLPFEFCRTR